MYTGITNYNEIQNKIFNTAATKINFYIDWCMQNVLSNYSLFKKNSCETFWKTFQSHCIWCDAKSWVSRATKLSADAFIFNVWQGKNMWVSTRGCLLGLLIANLQWKQCLDNAMCKRVFTKTAVNTTLCQFPITQLNDHDNW